MSHSPIFNAVAGLAFIFVVLAAGSYLSFLCCLAGHRRCRWEEENVAPPSAQAVEESAAIRIVGGNAHQRRLAKRAAMRQKLAAD